MSKFTNSKESVSSNLILWHGRQTQVGIRETYDMKVWPITNVYNDGPINFVIPEQSKGMLKDVHIVTKVKLRRGGEDLANPRRDVSVVNNFANSLWGQVDIQFDDRIDVTQSMRNAYAYKSFFNHVLNSNSDREDYLRYNEVFRMDTGKTKLIEEGNRDFWVWNQDLDEKIKSMMVDETVDKEGILEEVKELLWNFDHRFTIKSLTGISNVLGYTQPDELLAKNNQLRDIIDVAWLRNPVNEGASDRSSVINSGKAVIVDSKLQSPIFNTSKCLPHNMRIRISLTKNTDGFLLLSEDETYSIFIEDCYLHVTFIAPQDSFLKQIDERLSIQPAPYFIPKTELIIKPITSAGPIIRIHDIFHNKLPSHAFFCLQKSKDFEGSHRTNPFIFMPFQKFQFFLNGTPYFKEPLEVTTINDLGEGDYEYKGYGDYLRQLYKTVGVDLKGDCLINSENFALNFLTGISFGADRSDISENHLNLDERASTSLEIHMGINKVPDDMVLIVYAQFNRQIQIDGDRKLTIIE